jgi:2-methylcitrate dehydratase PrpD
MDGAVSGQQTAELTRTLAAQASAVAYEAVPDPVRTLARQCILDYYGVALAGAADPLARILLDEALDAGGAPQASVIADAARLPILAAALVNGAAGHALDYDDVNLAMPGHTTVAILPALLALAEHRKSSGREVIAAFVAGYETACRIGSALRPGHYERGFHATGTVGAFGAAAACARLLGLDAETTARALGIAGTQAAGLKSQFGTMCKPARRCRTGSWRHGSRRAGFRAEPTSSNACRASPRRTGPIFTRRRRSSTRRTASIFTPTSSSTTPPAT